RASGSSSPCSSAAYFSLPPPRSGTGSSTSMASPSGLISSARPTFRWSGSTPPPASPGSACSCSAAFSRGAGPSGPFTASAWSWSPGTGTSSTRCGWWSSPWCTWWDDDSDRAGPSDFTARSPEPGASRSHGQPHGARPRHHLDLQRARHQRGGERHRVSPRGGRRRRLVAPGPAPRADGGDSPPSPRRARGARRSLEGRGGAAHSRRGRPPRAHPRRGPAAVRRHQGRHRGRSGHGGGRAPLRSPLRAQHLVSDQPAVGGGHAQHGAGGHRNPSRVQRRGPAHRRGRPRRDLGVRRPALRGDPPHAPRTAHALGRPCRSSPVDGLSLGTPRGDQPGPQRARGLDVVHRLPGRLRAGHRLGVVESAPRPHRADGAARRAADSSGSAEAVMRRDRLVVAIILGLALLGCDRIPGKPNAADRAPLASEVTAFGPLYKGSCAACHGADGRLGASLALNDPVYLALVPRDRLRKVIADGVTGTLQPAFAMSAGGTLTDAQVDALVTGLVSTWGKGGAVKSSDLPSYAASPGEAGRGQGGDAAAGRGCHGPEGKGGPKGGSVVDASFLALASDQYLRTVVIAGRTDLGMPDWRGYTPGPLTEKQISDVVAWLIAQRRPVPGRPNLPKEGGYLCRPPSVSPRSFAPPARLPLQAGPRPQCAGSGPRGHSRPRLHPRSRAAARR